MKIKLLDILSNAEPIKELQETKLPVKVSYRIMRLVNKIQPELDTYDVKRKQLIKEFGDINKDGLLQVTDPKKLEKFTIQIQELLNIEIDIDFQKIKVEELGDLTISPKLLVSFIFE